jgi:hypothetical protein
VRSANFARGPAIALLRSPHFEFGNVEDAPDLDRSLAEAGYLGDAGALDRLLETWRAADPTRGLLARAVRAGEILRELVRELMPLQSSAPAAEHLAHLVTFLTTHGGSAEEQDDRGRARRARGAILGTLIALRDAWARFDQTPGTATSWRRSAGGSVQTFAPRARL